MLELNSCGFRRARLSVPEGKTRSSGMRNGCDQRTAWLEGRTSQCVRLHRVQPVRRDGRVAEGARLESVYTARYPGFESLSLRHQVSRIFLSIQERGRNTSGGSRSVSADCSVPFYSLFPPKDIADWLHKRRHLNQKIAVVRSSQMTFRQNQFVHKPNKDGSYDSICMQCFQAAAKRRTLKQLPADEAKHVCMEQNLRRITSPKRSPRR